MQIHTQIQIHIQIQYKYNSMGKRPSLITNGGIKYLSFLEEKSMNLSKNP